MFNKFLSIYTFIFALKYKKSTQIISECFNFFLVTQ